VSASSTATRGSGSRAPFKRRGSILLTLIAVLTAVGLAPLASVAWKLIDLNREALTTAQQEYQLLLASSTAREIDAYVAGLQSEMIRVARTLGATVGRSGPVRQHDVRAILDDVTDDRMLCLHFAELQGDTVVSVASTLDPDRLDPLFAEGFARSAESLAGGPGGKASAAWISAPILLDGPKARAALVLSAPVVSAGTFRGVLSAVVDLQSAWDAVSRENRSGHVLFALDATGRVFAATSSSRVEPGADMNGSPLVSRFRAADGRATETLPFALESPEGSTTYLGSYKKTRQGWGIFVQAEERLVYWTVRDMVRSTRYWALAAFLLAVVTALVLAGTLSKPIQRLASASRDFAAGNLSTRVHVGSRNEIGELAATFNLMASEIEEYIRRLRQAAEENRELFIGTINALTAAIDAKDPYTRGHSERVNAYAVTLARTMGLPEDQIWEINVASRLHDVGKIAIDDAVLRKPGMLTPEEMEHMKTHPVRGAAIMAPIGQMARMIPGLRNHHERWAGGGYPDGLQGEEIPLMARIIAVADTFDATTTERPYQRAMTFDQARARINELAGKVLDVRVVEAFNHAYESGAFRQAPRREAPVEAVPS
jgi:HD-GYP domain-containing protein (c-di-GMP phosphodiesterase class II)